MNVSRLNFISTYIFPASMAAAIAAGSCASLGASGKTGSGMPEDALTIEELVKDITSYDGHEVAVRGYFTYEPENRSIWKAARPYGVYDDPCIAIEVPDSIYNRREEYSYLSVIVHGIAYEPYCPFEPPGHCISPCGGIWIDVKRISSAFGTGDFPEQPISGDNWFLIDSDAPDIASLRALAERFTKAVRDGLAGGQRRQKLSLLVPERHRVKFARIVAEPDSRPNWLLFDSPRAFGRLLARHAVTLTIAQESAEMQSQGDTAYFCHCSDGDCDPRGISKERIDWRAALDPLVCIPVNRENGEWFLDAGFLAGAPYEEDLY